MFYRHTVSFLLILIAMSASAKSTPLCSLDDAVSKWPTQYVRSNGASIRVIVQGSGPTIVIVPSLGRDAGVDFDHFSSALAKEGYLVLRPQPRGALGSTGPILNVTIEQQAADIATVIDVLGGGKAIVLGHAFGHFIAQILASSYPEKVPAIIFAAAQTSGVSADISRTPVIAANLSAPVETRLAALRLGFFTPDHDPKIWLTGWWPETSKMQQDAIAAYRGNMSEIAAGGPVTQLLEVVADQDPFEVPGQRGVLMERFPERVVQEVVYDASHALYPEQPLRVLEAVLPWLKKHSSKVCV